MTVLDLITEAFAEIGVYAQGEVPSAADANFAMSKLNRMLDAWNAQKLYVYVVDFANYTLVPGLIPHTIGPSGATYTVAQRPVRIEAANVIQNAGLSQVNTPLNIRPIEFWQGMTVPNVSTSIPTDLYYAADWPNGKMYIWPVPTVAYGLQLWTWKVLSEFTALTALISFPPGYRDMLAYSLAVALAPSFGKSVPVELLVLMKMAKDAVFGLNSVSPRILTTDTGIPDASYAGLPSFNWKIGSSSR